ncbi:cytochrome c peroxidase [Actimicrobium sp. CCI2.3]|uniref:cytochrome c peroxidase n=1 Tax=Actimicrobium sp. CCI2.3 TaxID=3048616 RepID=UPI002AB4324B|nr:cytochrome c peroxidase [Actimicrobium sp. CCI2.3]MDY7575772.1 cytochrome c peroxidase [Actimicrobium sp. CCI2.3]MEB0023699.1 cytochrome c peroxidase [Actimicrobium sp. CCI2.3]
MKNNIRFTFFAAVVISLAIGGEAVAADYLLTPSEEDHKWLLPASPVAPADNQLTPARAELGKALFFDPRLSSDGNLSCASCHNPMLGWSDGLPTAKGNKSNKSNKSKVPGRATPTIINTAYNTLQMWDGRKSSLEDQAIGPMESMDEMAMDLTALFKWLNAEPTYKEMFAQAYPGEAIDRTTVAKGIASFERTVISSNSAFDLWLRGDELAMTRQQIIGFRLFSDAGKGNCIACHQAPNFTDGGFHNIGLASNDRVNPDVGRYAIKPVAALKGAFKTPTLRDISLTAPYFHDGSARTLVDVVTHYNLGGVSKTNLSPNMKPLALSPEEVSAIVAFMQALTTPVQPFTLPILPSGDAGKGNCIACHQAPNVTDGGFHHIGLASNVRVNPDVGRYALKPLATLRDISLTAPYFHDGSARTLVDVVTHYNLGGVSKSSLSPNMKPLASSPEEASAIVAFIQKLTTPAQPFVLPQLPSN